MGERLSPVGVKRVKKTLKIAEISSVVEFLQQQKVTLPPNFPPFLPTLIKESESKEDGGNVVRRPRLIKPVVDLCRRARETGSFNNASSQNVFIHEYYGAAGVGKTVILSQLYREIEEKFGDSYYLRAVDLGEVLGRQKNDRWQGPPLNCQGMCLEEYKKKLVEEMGLTYKNKEGDDERLRVIFIDNSEWFAMYPDFQRWFEGLIIPHIQSGKVLFVLAGRFMSRWSNFSIRYRLQQMEVPGFTPNEVRQLILKYPGISENWIDYLYYNYTWGYPVALAELLKRGFRSEENRVEVLGEVIKRLVVHIKRNTQEMRLDSLPYDLLVEGALLRVFAAGTLRNFYYTIRGKPYDLGDFREAMRILQRSTLVTWSNYWGGYVVDQPVRYTILSWLRLNNRKVFAELQKRAKEMYERRARKYPMSFPGYVTEFLYHSGWEAKARYEDVRDSLPEWEKDAIINHFKELIEYSFNDIGVRWNGGDLLNEQKSRLSDDEELEMLLGKDLVQDLINFVEDFKSSFLKGPC